MGFLNTIPHYCTLIRESLKNERQQPKQDRTADELNFLPAALEVVETPAPPAGRALLFLIISLFSVALAWACIGKIDIIATARGKILPTERVKAIQPLTDGLVKAIHVNDGQIVQAGDLLVELDPIEAQTDYQRTHDELVRLQVRITGLQTLLMQAPDSPLTLTTNGTNYTSSVQQQLLHRWQSFQAQQKALLSNINKKQLEINTLQAVIEVVKSLLPNLQERVVSFRTLEKNKYASRDNLLQLEQELISQQGQLDIQRSRLREYQADYLAMQDQYKAELAKFRESIANELAEVEKQHDALSLELVRIQQRISNSLLRAPVDGYVQELSVHTVGGVVKSGEKLLSIVPQAGGIEVEAMIQNTDIGWVHRGQITEVKVDSFPFTKYGLIDGAVYTVSADAVSDERMGLVYPARIQLSSTEILTLDGPQPLTSGMGVTVEIKTGQRRVIEYLLAPFQEYQSEGLRER